MYSAKPAHVMTWEVMRPVPQYQACLALTTFVEDAASSVANFTYSEEYVRPQTYLHHYYYKNDFISKFVFVIIH